MIAAGAFVTWFGPVACRAAVRDPTSFLDYVPTVEHRKIAEGRSDFDCAPSLQRALNETATLGAILWIPRGIYFVSPAHELDHADSFSCQAAVRMVSGMRVHGERGTLLRMASGFSTDRAPRAMAMFAATGPIADVELKGLVLDMNGRENPISPDRAVSVYNRFPQAQIFVSGGGGRTAARVDRVRISDTVFRDANGVSCIVMGQTHDRNATLGQDWVVERCRFLDNGMDTDDHSSIFAYAEGVQVANCEFANVAPFGPTGVNTAYEVHGSRQTIRECTFKNMLRGVWVANNYSKNTTGTMIELNRFQTVFYGIDFFNDRAEAREITGTVISNNQFNFDDYQISSIPGLNFKAAVQIASEFGQRDIRLTKNTVTKTGHAVTSAFLVVTGGASGSRRHDAITATDNQGHGLTFGSFIRTTATAGLGHLVVMRNKWTGLSTSATMAISAGDAIEHTGKLQPIQSLTLGDGSTQAIAKGRPAKPIYINAFVQSLVLKPVTGYGPANSPIELGGSARLETIDHHGL